MKVAHWAVYSAFQSAGALEFGWAEQWVAGLAPAMAESWDAYLAVRLAALKGESWVRQKAVQLD